MYTNEQKQTIIQYYQEGKSINWIANTLSTRWESVKNLLIRENLYQQVKRNGQGIIQPEIIRFNQIDSNEAAYWLGFLYADGNIREAKPEITLTLKESDYETVKAFHDYCGNQNKIYKSVKHVKGKDYISYTSSFTSQTTKQNLINLGCTPRKSLTLICPSEQQVPNEFLHPFFRGYIDGDGYIQYDTNKHRYRIIVLGTEDFLTGMKERLNLQDNAKISKTATKAFQMVISHKDFVYDFLTKLYDNNEFALPRKKEIYLQAKQGR